MRKVEDIGIYNFIFILRECFYFVKYFYLCGIFELERFEDLLKYIGMFFEGCSM